MAGGLRTIALVLLAVGLLVLPAAPAGAAVASAAPKVAVYRGAAGCRGCSEMVVDALRATGLPLTIVYVGEREALHVTPATLRDVDVYIQPGGGQDIPAAYAALGDAGAAALRDFVSGGKGFLGLCMGAYLADRDGIGLVDVALQSEVGRPRSGIDDEGDHTIAIRWDGTWQRVYYQDGPFLTGSAADGFVPVAQYGNGDVAIARYRHGRGTVVLAGPHPEADERWMDEEDDEDDVAPQDNLRRLLRLFPGLGAGAAAAPAVR
ncbi:MAG: BPL-N domain-containing protein [Xanthomonas sp.]